MTVTSNDHEYHDGAGPQHFINQQSVIVDGKGNVVKNRGSIEHTLNLLANTIKLHDIQTLTVSQLGADEFEINVMTPDETEYIWNSSTGFTEYKD